MARSSLLAGVRAAMHKIIGRGILILTGLIRGENLLKSTPLGIFTIGTKGLAFRAQ